MKTRTFSLLIAILSCITILTSGCAPALNYYIMPSISQTINNPPDGFVLLAVGDSNNVIGIHNDSLYFEYNIYKKKHQESEYQKYETIQIPTTPHCLRAFTYPYRDKNYSLDDRYLIKPVSNGEELDAIPLRYYTMDSAYFEKIEPYPIATEPNIRLYRLILFIEKNSK